MNVIVCAIPVFIALMAAEFGVGLAAGRNEYRLNDGWPADQRTLPTHYLAQGLIAFCVLPRSRQAGRRS